MKTFLKNFDNHSVLLIIGLALFDTFGQFSFKKHKTEKSDYKLMFLFAGFISYFLYSICVFDLVQRKKLATASILHILSHFIILGILFGLGKFHFGEKYNTREIIGLTLGVISIYILLTEPHSHSH